jgi:hypothetical protein
MIHEVPDEMVEDFEATVREDEQVEGPLPTPFA